MPNGKGDGGVSPSTPGMPAQGSRTNKKERSKIKIYPMDGNKGSMTSIPPVEVSSYKELASDEDNCPFFYDDDMGVTELAWDPRVLHKLAPLHGKTRPIHTNKSINTRNTSSAHVHKKMSRQQNSGMLDQV